MIDFNLLDKFSGFNVLIIGDLMLDRYWTGQVTRVSPEANVPVVNFENEEYRLGGAANVALNVAALGAKPFLCGITGQDFYGNLFHEQLPTDGINGFGVVSSKERITTVKTRIIAGHQHLLRVDRENSFDLTDNEQEILKRTIVELLNSTVFHAAILQDYNKGVLSRPIIHFLLDEFYKRNIPVAVDPKFKNFWEYRRVALFKPNLSEVKGALSKEVQTGTEYLSAACSAIRKKLNNKLTLVTLSDKGVFIDDGEFSKSVPTRARNVADVSGAGDTVISIAALALAAGMDSGQIAVLANYAGGQVVERVGVVPVDLIKLKAELRAMMPQT